MAEQRYQAVLAVIADGATVTEVAGRFGVSRKTVHAWLNKYEAGGLEALGDGSHRPRSCPHQMPALVEVALVEMRRAHPWWGPRRLVHELGRAGVEPVPSESGVYRALSRLGLIDPGARRPREWKFKRWERGAPMELWQMDVVGGFALADGRRVKALTGVDDHSRFCVSAFLMLRESSQRVCEGLALAMGRYGIPGQVLTDNGKVFTGRFNRPPVEVLFDRVFASMAAAQAELDAWVEDYNHQRPHQALEMATPASRFGQPQPAPVAPLRLPVGDARPAATRGDGDWVARRASRVGVVSVAWQQVALGQAAAGRDIDVWVTDQVLQFWDGATLLRTQARKNPGTPVRKKRASIPGGRVKLNTSVTTQPE